MFDSVDVQIFVSINGKSMERLLNVYRNRRDVDLFGDTMAAELLDLLRRYDFDEDDIYINNSVTVNRG